MNDEIAELCTNGLLTDVAHHKQWYLEEILKKLGFSLGELRIELEEEGYSWEPGIIP